MNCKRCGAKIEKGCFFCDRCGQSIGTVAELEELGRRESLQKKRKILTVIVILAVILVGSYSFARVMYEKKSEPPQPADTSTVLTENTSAPSPEAEEKITAEAEASSGPSAEPIQTPEAKETVKPTVSPSAKPTVKPTVSPAVIKNDAVTAPSAEPIADDAIEENNTQTVQIQADGAYLYPSDTTLFTSEFLASLNKQSARLVRNELYARHGLVFKTADLKNYFSAKSWYKPVRGITTTQILNKFNATERSNHHKLVAYEKSKKWIR